MAKRLEVTERSVTDGEPRTPLGRQLAEIRSRIVASGERLLDWDEIDREVALRRGGQDSSQLARLADGSN
jgi:hypothetical protein